MLSMSALTLTHKLLLLVVLATTVTTVVLAVARAHLSKQISSVDVNSSQI
jgi:hypothetical protein